MKNKAIIPYLISIFLIFVGGGVTLVLILHNAQSRIISGLIDNIIQVWICVGAFISVVFVLSSYIQTNRAFVISNKPFLLLFVNNEYMEENCKSTHNTVIHYNNNSSNPFYDLSISVVLVSNGISIDLSELFTEEMYMSPGDCRFRRFKTLEELNKRGFDLASESKAKKPIILSLSYRHTYCNKTEIIKVQDYIWDINLEKPQWSIK